MTNKEKFIGLKEPEIQGEINESSGPKSLENPKEGRSLAGDDERREGDIREAERIKSEINESLERGEQKDRSELVWKLRLPHQEKAEPVELDSESREVIGDVALDTEKRIRDNYQEGFGIFPSSNPNENFYAQVWTRDFAHASGNYFAETEPKALIDSLNTILGHQRSDGMLPLRVEKEYMMLKVIPGFRSLAKPVFDIIEKGIKGREERPVYEGQDFSSAEDTVPSAIIAAGEFFISSPEGREYLKENFEKLKKAVDFFIKKTDPRDGLAVMKKGNPDWADSINRSGKLGGINVWWVRSLRLMEYMARQLGDKEAAETYRTEFRKAKEGMMDKIYNKEEGYFRSAEGEDRVDSVASVFGALYFLSPEEAVKVEETLKSRVKHASGLKNFDPPYPEKQVIWPQRAIKHGGYHNEHVWPWVTLQNIQVKIKIALKHPDEAIREQYKREAVDDLLDVAKLFKEAGGAYETFKPDNRQPAISKLYKPPKNLMGNLAAFQGAYRQLKELGWISAGETMPEVAGVDSSNMEKP